MNPATQLWLIIPGFVLVWVIVCHLIARTSGWHQLGLKYRSDGSYTGNKSYFCSARINWSSYGTCLTMGANTRGLLISINPLFFPGHPPLFIPWTDLTIKKRGGWFFNYFDLVAAATPPVTLTIGEKLGMRLSRDAGRAFPLEIHDV